jgi:DNA polymerase III delta prime subunit
MDTKETVNGLNRVIYIAEKAYKCKLSSDFFWEIDPYLESLATQLHLSKSQVFLLANIMSLNYKSSGSVGIKDLAEYFESTPLRLLEYNADLEYLSEMGALKKEFNNRASNLILSKHNFILTENFSEALINNKPFVPVKVSDTTDFIDFLEKVNTLVDERAEKNQDTYLLLADFILLKNINAHIPFVSKINDLKLNWTDSIFFCYLCWQALDDEDLLSLSSTAKLIINTPKARYSFVRSIVKKYNKLVTKKLIETNKSLWANDLKVKLTNKSKEILFGEDAKIYIKQEHEDDIHHAKAIKKKTLYYNAEENDSIRHIYDICREEHYNVLKQRLAEKRLPIGLVILFYGSPGTGKTETVYQVARETGRTIMHVDISQAKSMWFGESEKQIRNIFTSYEVLKERTELCPILLFNEADAIISKRKDSSSSSVAQTENAMQNIILEELEKFKGILIATTNMVVNFDKAFERRFLFKLEFKPPTLLTREKIWKSKLKGLNKTEYRALASNFNLSGAQIDNVVRKIITTEVTKGYRPNFTDILNFCEEEGFGKKMGGLGFVR